jgi:hypothetical protein
MCLTNFNNPGVSSETDRKKKNKLGRDMDSFLIPLLEELRVLACDGVEAVRVLPGRPSARIHFRAHVISVSGDMPAVAKVSEMQASVNTNLPPLTISGVTADELQGSQRNSALQMLYYARHPCASKGGILPDSCEEERSR